MPVSAATHQLHSAIRANAVDAVRELLETGTDPNLSPPIPTFDDEKEYDDDDETTISKDHWFLRTKSEGKVTPLHMAIANCYHNFGDPDCNYDSNAPRARNARAILQLPSSSARAKSPIECPTSILSVFMWVATGSVWRRS